MAKPQTIAETIGTTAVELVAEDGDQDTFYIQLDATQTETIYCGFTNAVTSTAYNFSVAPGTFFSDQLPYGAGLWAVTAQNTADVKGYHVGM